MNELKKRLFAEIDSESIVENDAYDERFLLNKKSLKIIIEPDDLFIIIYSSGYAKTDSALDAIKLHECFPSSIIVDNVGYREVIKEGYLSNTANRILKIYRKNWK